MYRIGFGYEKESSESLVKWQVDETISRICEACDASEYEIYLTSTDKSNFRFAISSSYKATRNARKPKWYETIRGFLSAAHDANIVSNMEADDALGMALSRGGQNTVCASIDKDLLQVPGRHFHFVKNTVSIINEFDGMYNLCTQILTGDRVDNITGISGVGPATAKKLLKNVTTEAACSSTCYEVYKAKFGETEGHKRFLENVQLLYILREENDSALKMLVSKVGWKMNSDGSLIPPESSTSTSPSI